jgi:DNA-binding NarL/FixJ family response regulator
MLQTETIGVAVIDDELSMRRGLGLIIEGTPGYHCIGTYSSVEEALRSIGSETPDVLLLDIHLPGGMLGSEGVRVLLDKYPAMQVLMLTISDEEEKIFESLCNGASGYLLKKTPPAELLEAIRNVHEGGAPMSPEVARRVVRLFQKIAPPEKIDYDLTPHEVRVLGLLAQGYSYQTAARKLNVSINTIRTYVRNIYDKLHVHSKSAAVHKALKSGILS